MAHEILKSFFAGFFFVFGFLTAVGLLALVAFIGFRIYKKRKKAKPTTDLVRAFEIYRQQLEQNEEYEEAQTVNMVLSGLRKGEIKQAYKLYDVTEDTQMVTGEDEEGFPTFRLFTTFKINKKF